jgi:hypothetical protein
LCQKTKAKLGAFSRKKAVSLDVSFRVQVQSPRVRHWQRYGYLNQEIGETGMIYILRGVKVFRLPRFFEGELISTPGGPKRKGRLTIAEEVS